MSCYSSSSQVQINPQMKLIPFLLITTLSLPAWSQGSKRELTDHEVSNFEARPNVVKFAPVDLPTSGWTYYLVTGERADDTSGDFCLYPDHDEFSLDLLGTKDEPKLGVFETDYLLDSARCEKVVLRGLVPTSALEFDANNIPFEIAGESIEQNVGSETFTYSGSLDFPNSSVNRSTARTPEVISRSNIMTSIASVVLYHDGGHPIIQLLPFTLEANQNETGVSFTTPVCSPRGGQYQADASARMFPSGWIRTQLGQLRYDLACSYSCSRGNCQTTSGSFSGATVFLQFKNSAFPGCFPGVFANYHQNEIAIDYRNTVRVYRNVSISGKMQGCGEYLRRSTFVFRR